MYIEFLRLRLYPAVVVLTSMTGSIFSPVYAEEKPYEQQFVITAYYSPLPDQCCYFRGSYDEEIVFNGKGIAGADGTPVYPGMIAAPESYLYGTTIELPGLGVGTVHDRGGRIIEWGDDAHRIDLWMGYGEEGLARAMAWGVRTVKGTVYPAGFSEAPNEDWSLDRFDEDTASLASLPKTDPFSILTNISMGDRTYGVRSLQQLLKDQGYFEDHITSQFGPVTAAALHAFQRDYGLPGDGTRVDSVTAATLLSASTIGPENLPVLDVGMERGTSGHAVRQAQKLLRYLGYYSGRTDGVFGDALRDAVLSFQKDQGVLRSDTDSGAGRVGPATRAAIHLAWKVEVASLKAKALMRRHEIASKVKSEVLPKNVLASGDRGHDVRLLQIALVRLGYLPGSDATSMFGPRTEAALLRYQLDHGIIPSDTAKGAGVFGPSTRLSLRQSMIDLSWHQVRAGGLPLI